ncbi:unnamed protein product [Urochloa humidicola]
MIPPVADPAMLDGGAQPLLPETDPRRAATGADAGQRRRRPPSTVLPAVVSAVLLLVLAAVGVLALQHVDVHGGGGAVAAAAAGRVVEVASSRGAAEGVSEKSTAPLLGAGGAAVKDYAWTNAMLAWQRTAFHFQPPKNWMNG